MAESLMDVLARIEQSVRASDGEAILARWDFGRAVLEQRQGKQLPKGLLDEICKHTGIGRREVGNRIQVAEHYDREQLCSSLQSSSPTWTALVNGLPNKRVTPKRSPKAPPEPQLPPTKAAIAKADRVAALIVEPDVAAVLTQRAADDEASAKARKLAEKRERAKAKAQKERDQEIQQIEQVLRARLVRGDTDWQNLTEQMETMADTVRRLITLLDGLPVPDQLHRKMFERHLAATQQALFELRRRLSPTHDEEAAEVSSRSVIEAVAR